jgi:hypothetical protein
VNPVVAKEEYDKVVLMYGMRLVMVKKVDSIFWTFINQYWETTVFMWDEMYKALVRMEMPLLESLDAEERGLLREQAMKVCYRQRSEKNLVFFEKIIHCINHLTYHLFINQKNKQS